MPEVELALRRAVGTLDHDHNDLNSISDDDVTGVTGETVESDMHTAPDDGEDCHEPGLVDRADNLARFILEHEFDVQLWDSEPTIAMIEAVTECLQKLSTALRLVQECGFIAATPPQDHENGKDVSQVPSGTGGGGSFPEAQRKRPGRNGGDRDNNSGDERSNTGEDDGGKDGGSRRGGPSGPKRTKIEQDEEDEKFPCPFRKRDAYTFNFRNIQSAPRGHFKLYRSQRQLAFKCPRCHERFATDEQCKTHIKADIDKICAVKEENALSTSGEEATHHILRALSSRTRKLSVDSWEKLWRVLFPADTDVPDSSFEPLVDISEVMYEYQQAAKGFFGVQLPSVIETIVKEATERTEPTTERGVRQLPANENTPNPFESSRYGHVDDPQSHTEDVGRLVRGFIEGFLQRARSRAFKDDTTRPSTQAHHMSTYSPASIATPSSAASIGNVSIISRHVRGSSSEDFHLLSPIQRSKLLTRGVLAAIPSALGGPITGHSGVALPLDTTMSDPPEFRMESGGELPGHHNQAYSGEFSVASALPVDDLDWTQFLSDIPMPLVDDDL
ncbi:hypothetical protein OQA88_679 [Cercophora sp. LCS_1]